MTTTTTTSDYISALPDPLISHILSFLPTKSAAATSLLSKRWTPLWLSVPILDFDEEEEEPIHHITISQDGVVVDDDEEDDFFAFIDRRICFLQMVHDAFSKRDVTQSVLKFRLKTCYSKAVHVCKWVNTAIQRGVEHLDLVLSYGVKFPAHILGCRTLVVLKLKGCQIDGVFVDGFPNLRVLHLNDLYFVKHRYLMQLLFGCPILEELCVGSLVVYDGYCNNDDDAGGFQSLHKLVSAVVLTPAHYIPFTCICNVKSLILRIHEEFPEVTCTFRNLTSLELRVDIFRVCDNNLDCHFVDVFKVLQHCPKLQNLEILMKADSKDVTDKYKWVQPQFVPECLSSHVRICTLRGCKGWDSEFQFAKYMLQNSKVLSSMRICSELFSNPLSKLEITEKLSFPWGSETCELHLDVMQ